MKYFFTFLVSVFITSISIAQLNMTLLDRFQYGTNTNDVWGYMAPSGDEYALVGTRVGLSIIDINTDSLFEVDFIQGQNSTWRDIKTWGDFAYVSTEQTDGLLVVDLRNLPDSTSHFFWKPEFENQGTLLRIHNIFIDEFGILYISGANINGGGVMLVDVNTNPGQPELISFAPSRYSHDAYARDSILYSSEINDGTLSIYDISNPDSITLEGRTSTPSDFTHNAWLSDDSKTIFTTDERPNAFIASYDITDFGNIIELDRFRPAATKLQGVVPHNVHVWNDWLIISYYTDGCILVDASRPDNLIEVGNFDTFLPDDPDNRGFGAWGAYPFLPSGKVLITDSGNGLYVLEPNYVRGAFLEGTVQGKSLDENNDIVLEDLMNAKIEVLSEEIVDSTFSGGMGVFKTGKGVPGKFPVQISFEGYNIWTDSVVFENGVVTELNVILNKEGVSTSIQNNPEILAQIQVFPNPISNILNIDLSNFDQEVQTISVLNNIGQIIENQAINEQQSQFRLNASHWSPGVYFANITAKDGTQGVFKVVKN